MAGKKRKSQALARIVTNPETGEEVALQPHDGYPEMFRYVAKVMFLSGAHTTASISQAMNIPLNTIRSWQTRENWTALKREVNRMAAQEAVRDSRRAMSKYIVDIDRGANEMLEEMNKRIKGLGPDKLIDNEQDARKFILELWKIKLQIVRILNFGTESRGFTPHPADLQFDGTAAKPPVSSLTANSAEVLLNGIPTYLREATNMVLGVDAENLDPAMLDAVAKHIDEKLKELENDPDDNMLF
jgi:hypothetical protein